MATWSDRAFYRLVYPIVCRPLLRVAHDAFPVIDLSEGGIRFRATEWSVWSIGTEFTGEVGLQTAGAMEVQGQIIRIEGVDIGARLIRGVPFSVMLEEQRYLTRRFTGRV